MRCVYLAGQDECRECRFRGCPCIGQSIDTTKNVTKRTKSTRERISELEALVQALLAGKVTDSPDQARAFVQDVTPLTPVSSADSPASSRIPLMRMFDNVVVSLRRDFSRFTSKYVQISQVHDHVTIDRHLHTDGLATPSISEETPGLSLGSKVYSNETTNTRFTDSRALKDKYTRTRLLEYTDFGQGLDVAFQENEQRWRAWRYRILGGPPSENLGDWARSVIRDGSPSDIGVLVLFLGTGSDHAKSKGLVPPVAALITSDDDYKTTLSGIECCLLLADYHARMGQPRRAWLAVQTGLASAQLVVSLGGRNHDAVCTNVTEGLHRYRSSPLCTGIWLLLHHNNQFLSLILGVPHGIDFRCDNEYIEPWMSFKAKLSTLCNRFLIQTHDRSEPSAGIILDLDQQLQALALLIPAEWRDVQASSPDSTEVHSSSIHYERILMQMHLQQLRTYLYLPFMLGSGLAPPMPTPMHEMSRIACLQSSRALLKFYHLLAKESIHENALLDFVGFSAAMLIVLNLLGYHRLQDGDKLRIRESKQDEQDWQIIDTTIGVLADRAKKDASKVACQSLEVLRKLSNIRTLDFTIPPGCSYRFVVPLLGEILVQSGTKFSPVSEIYKATSSDVSATIQTIYEPMYEHTESASKDVSNQCWTRPNARNSIIVSAFSGWNPSGSVPQKLAESEMSSFHTSLNDTQGLGVELEMEPMLYGQPWQYSSGMDLNQDWLWFAEPTKSDQNNRIC